MNRCIVIKPILIVFLLNFLSFTAFSIGEEAKNSSAAPSRSPAVIGAPEDVINVEALAREVQNIAKLEDNVKALQKATNVLRGIGSVNVDCIECDGSTQKNVQMLIAKELELDRVYFLKSYEPSVVYLKRTSETPSKVTLSFKNPAGKGCYEGAGVIFIHPLSGALITGCQMEKTIYETEYIQIDFSKLPKLKSGESEFYQLKIIKEDIREEQYEIDLLKVNAEDAKVEKSKTTYHPKYDYKFVVSTALLKEESSQ